MYVQTVFRLRDQKEVGRLNKVIATLAGLSNSRLVAYAWSALVRSDKDDFGGLPGLLFVSKLVSRVIFGLETRRLVV